MMCSKTSDMQGRILVYLMPFSGFSHAYRNKLSFYEGVCGSSIIF